MATAQHRCVFVGNIPYDATEEQLIQICEEVGPVVSFRLVIDRETGKPKGYGFCEYKDEETALSARRNLQGYEINGRQLRVDFAENDKGSDRNRDQGRGGPGIAANVDTQKQVGGPAAVADSTPVGIPLAMTAASVMAGALGGPQTGHMNQNGFQIQSPVGNDPLTHHLAKMPRSQLNQVIHEMKVLATQNKDLARQLLLVSPLLPKALFQAQIMLGMVTPQMLQMPNIRQQALNPLPQSSLQPAVHGQQIAVQTLPGLPSYAPSPPESQSSLAQNQFSGPLPLPPQTRVPLPTQSQIGRPQHITVPSLSGPLSVASVRPLPPSTTSFAHSFRPVQPPSLQHTGPAVQLVIPNANIQSSSQGRPVSTDPIYQAVSPARSGLLETNAESFKHSQPIRNAALVGRGQSTMTNVPPLSNKSDSLDQMVRPSKLVKLEDGRGAPFSSARSAGLCTTESVAGNANSVQPFPTSTTPQGMEKQDPEGQFPTDVDPALLQQVLNLTPEQLSSLPPELQQQVVQLQQKLR